MAALAAHLARGRSVLVGHSGAGKTSLLNALVPGLALATAAVRRSDARGRHTTSAATLVELPGGGQVLDTPGLREFGLWAISRQDLRRHFEEIARLASACRFRDCSHRAEPECAVRAAAGKGELPAGRYRSYLRLLAECVP
jgi:ribosome biogenesis GTPase